MARLTSDEMCAVYEEVLKIKRAVLALDNLLAEHTDEEANEYIENCYPLADDLDSAAWECMNWAKSVANICKANGCNVERVVGWW